MYESQYKDANSTWVMNLCVSRTFMNVFHKRTERRDWREITQRSFLSSEMLNWAQTHAQSMHQLLDSLQFMYGCYFGSFGSSGQTRTMTQGKNMLCVLFWTVSRTKQAIWRHQVGLEEIVTDIFWLNKLFNWQLTSDYQITSLLHLNQIIIKFIIYLKIMKKNYHPHSWVKFFFFF